LRLTEEQLAEAVALYHEHGNERTAAVAAGCAPSTFHHRLARAAERGLLGTKPVLPGFRISQTTSTPHGDFVQQKPEHGAPFELPAGQTIKGVSALVDADGREIIKWVKTATDREQQFATMRAVVDALKEELPRATPLKAPLWTNGKLLSQYTVTDLHFGSLAWHEETGDADYDLAIAERLLMDWFTAAIQLSPRSRRAVFAQIGDLLHHDSHDSVTPTHRHIIDSDSRLQKVIRVVIRCLRRIVAMLLEKHEQVHIVMADANHDPASEAWLREIFAAFYEDEPRITVERSADTYYSLQHGQVSLFWHHGHKRSGDRLAATLAGKFRELFGRTRYSYAHIGHRHSDDLKSSDVGIKVEQHETLAARSSYEAHGGWLAGRSSKVITYHEDFGEVHRSILTPEMVATFAADNDNRPQTGAVAA
jgi:hypothetical protein